MLAASGIAIAASLWSLVAPRSAVQRYRLAAETYRHLRHDYWIPLAIASGSAAELARGPGALAEAGTLSPQAVAFGMLALEMPGVGDADAAGAASERLHAAWRATGSVPVGRLGLPLELYVRCAEAVRRVRLERDADRFVDDAAAYVRRAAEVLRSASHDRYHWTTLHSAILPAEPEAAAVAVLLAATTRESVDLPLGRVLRRDLDAHGRRLVEVGDELYEAGRLEAAEPDGEGPQPEGEEERRREELEEPDA
jgi:hypothetical protein